MHSCLYLMLSMLGPFESSKLRQWQFFRSHKWRHGYRPCRRSGRSVPCRSLRPIHVQSIRIVTPQPVLAPANAFPTGGTRALLHGTATLGDAVQVAVGAAVPAPRPHLPRHRPHHTLHLLHAHLLGALRLGALAVLPVHLERRKHARAERLVRGAAVVTREREVQGARLTGELRQAPVAGRGQPLHGTHARPPGLCAAQGTDAEQAQGRFRGLVQEALQPLPRLLPLHLPALPAGRVQLERLAYVADVQVVRPKEEGHQVKRREHTQQGLPVEAQEAGAHPCELGRPRQDQAVVDRLAHEQVFVGIRHEGLVRAGIAHEGPQGDPRFAVPVLHGQRDAHAARVGGVKLRQHLQAVGRAVLREVILGHQRTEERAAKLHRHVDALQHRLGQDLAHCAQPLPVGLHGLGVPGLANPGKEGHPFAHLGGRSRPTGILAIPLALLKQASSGQHHRLKEVVQHLGERDAHARMFAHHRLLGLDVLPSKQRQHRGNHAGPLAHVQPHHVGLGPSAHLRTLPQLRQVAGQQQQVAVLLHLAGGGVLLEELAGKDCLSAGPGVRVPLKQGVSQGDQIAVPLGLAHQQVGCVDGATLLILQARGRRVPRHPGPCQLQQHHPQGPQVLGVRVACGHALPRKHLRGGIARGVSPHGQRCLGRLQVRQHIVADPKVTQRDLAVILQQHILRLEVTVHDALAVEEGHRLEDLLHRAPDLRTLLGGQTRCPLLGAHDAVNPATQVPILVVGHLQVGHVVIDEHPLQGDHQGVLQRLQPVDLPTQLRPRTHLLHHPLLPVPVLHQPHPPRPPCRHQGGPRAIAELGEAPLIVHEVPAGACR
eukprot:jgi/Mesvir1/17146/Mv07570-RA.1